MAPMTIHIGELSEDTQKEDLEKEFGRFGNLSKVWVARNPPGFAFIDFENDADAEEAIKEMNGVMFNGSEIRVAVSRSRSKRGRGRGSRGDGFRRDRSSRGGFGMRQDRSFESGFRRGGNGGRGGQGRNFESGFRHEERSFLQRVPSYGSGGYDDGGSRYRSRSPISQRSNWW